MKNIPDVLGMEFEKAKALLEAEGLDFIVKETKPTRKQPIEGTLRIIKAIDREMTGCGCTLTEDQMPVTSRSGLILTVCKI